MVYNGYIAFVSETQAGRDADFNEIEATNTVGVWLPCNLLVITHDYRVFAEGQQLQAKYSVIIDEPLVKDINIAACNKVQLMNSDSSNIGTFQIINNELLKTTNKRKIVV